LGTGEIHREVNNEKIFLVEKSRIRGVVAVVTKEFYNEVASKICEFISYES